MAVPTLSDVKAQLNITGTSQDSLLQTYLDACLRLVEARVGPSSIRSFTETVTGRSEALNLSYRPIVSITSVTSLLDTWHTVDPTGLEFDGRAGSVWRRDHGPLVGRWEVAYTAGWATFPDNYHLAVLVTVQHFWSLQRGGSKRPNQGSGDELLVKFGQNVTRHLRADTMRLPAMAESLIADGIYFGGIA